MPARELIANPKNWRRHPKAQRAALRAILEEVGFAGALLVRETAGGLMLIDGHLRAETTPDQIVPVLILDVDEVEADKLLLSFDPLAGLATADQANLQALTDAVSFESNDLTSLVRSLSEAIPNFEPAPADDQHRLDQKKKLTCPSCGHEFTP